MTAKCLILNLTLIFDHFCIFSATFEKPADPNSKKNQPDADPDAHLIKNPSKKIKNMSKY